MTRRLTRLGADDSGIGLNAQCEKFMQLKFLTNW